MISARAHAYPAHREAQQRLHTQHVCLARRGKLLEARSPGNVFLPARHVLVHHLIVGILLFCSDTDSICIGYVLAFKSGTTAVAHLKRSGHGFRHHLASAFVTVAHPNTDDVEAA